MTNFTLISDTIWRRKRCIILRIKSESKKWENLKVSVPLDFYTFLGSINLFKYTRIVEQINYLSER